MRFLLLPLFAFAPVCQDPLVSLDSLSLNQFGEKGGGHRYPELPARELVGRRDEGQARSIQLPLLVPSLCSSSTWQHLSTASQSRAAVSSLPT